MWQSMTGTRGIPWRARGGWPPLAVVVLAAAAGGRPARPPGVDTSLIFPSSSVNSSPVNSPSNLTDGSASLPAHAASPDGATRVGGYLGFAQSLDTAVRASLGNQVVLRVRASRPSFWVGETYDNWNGQSWLESAPTKGTGVSQAGDRVPVRHSRWPRTSQRPRHSGDTDVQTFYLAQSGPNLVFHADNAERVYIQSRALYLTGDGTIVSSTSMGAGTIYTVVSADNTATPEQLRDATVPVGAERRAVPGPDPRQADRYLQLPHPYPRVAALARQITAGTGANDADPETYDKVEAIEAWMADHIHYTTDIPPLAPGADTVTSFLFGSRRGYCEQISTATVVMLRTLGIPARETVGYVPGSYDPITDLYDVQAKDAHAWVQVWFPGYGWQSFDPTAEVPLANPSPGSVLAGTAGRALAHLPWIPIGLAVAVVVTVVEIRRRRRAPSADLGPPDRRRPRAAAGPGRAGADGSTRRCRPTAAAWPRADDRFGTGLHRRRPLVERYAYGGREPSAEPDRRRPGLHPRLPAWPAGGGAGSDAGSGRGPAASASSNEAPAASRGR